MNTITWPFILTRVRDGSASACTVLAQGAIVYLLLAAVGFSAQRAVAADDSLLPLLQGEFALQAGDTAAAASAYLEAAQISRDPALAERAAQIALLAGNPDPALGALKRWRALSPHAPGLAIAEARLALKRGARDAALAALTELLAGPESWRGAVQALAASIDAPIAAELLATLVQEAALPEQLDAWLAFGGLAQRFDQPETSALLAERATERFPQQPRAWLWQAEDAQRRKQPERARAAIERVLALGPLDVATRLAVAAQLDALGDPKAAANMLANGDQDDTTLAGRAAYLARAEDEAALAELYALMATEADNASDARLLLLGQLAELQQQTRMALDWYERIRAGRACDQAQLRIAVLLDQAGKLEEALLRLRELQASDSEYGEIVRDAYLLEAELLRQHRRVDAAMDAYARGLQIFEDDPELLYTRALAHEQQDRIDLAEADLRRLIELDPENADALNALGYTLADRSDRYQEALALIERALKLKPDTAAIIDSLGWVLFRLGRVEDALPHLRRAFELQRDAEIAAHLGEALWVRGDHDEARSIWRLGRELDPDHRVLRQALERYGE